MFDLQNKFFGWILLFLLCFVTWFPFFVQWQVCVWIELFRFQMLHFQINVHCSKTACCIHVKILNIKRKRGKTFRILDELCCVFICWFQATQQTCSLKYFCVLKWIDLNCSRMSSFSSSSLLLNIEDFHCSL